MARGTTGPTRQVPRLRELSRLQGHAETTHSREPQFTPQPSRASAVVTAVQSWRAPPAAPDGTVTSKKTSRGPAHSSREGHLHVRELLLSWRLRPEFRPKDGPPAYESFSV